MLRRYSESSRFYERAIAVSPSEYFFRLLRAAQPYFERADIRPLREELSAIPPRQTGDAGGNFIEPFVPLCDG